MPIIVLTTEQIVKKRLEQQNYDASDVIITASIKQASIKTKDIYVEAGKTFPTAIGQDLELDELVADLAAEIARKKLADTLEGKIAIQKDIDDAMTAIKLHIGIVEGKDQVLSTDPKVAIGPTLKSLGDSGGSWDSD